MLGDNEISNYYFNHQNISLYANFTWWKGIHVMEYIKLILIHEFGRRFFSGKRLKCIWLQLSCPIGVFEQNFIQQVGFGVVSMGPPGPDYGGPEWQYVHKQCIFNTVNQKTICPETLRIQYRFSIEAYADSKHWARQTRSPGWCLLTETLSFLHSLTINYTI